MEMLLLGIMLFITLGLGAAGFIISQNRNQVQARVDNLAHTATQTQPSASKGNNSRYQDSFTQRVVIPFAQSLSDRIQMLVPMGGKSWVKQKLTQAGYARTHHLKTFIGVHALSTLLPLGFILFLLLVSRSVSATTAILLMVFFVGMGFAFPLLWLIQQATRRQDSIRKALPDFLDLLVICVEAGLGLDMAISKMTKMESVETSPYLREELIRYTRDIGFGKRRKEALTDLANRTGVDDLNAIVNALIQSYEMGTGVVQALRVQSEGLRQKRLHRAEAQANKIAVKMVLPIYMFFFPGIFIVILGPLILSTVMQISQTMQNTY